MSDGPFIVCENLVKIYQVAGLETVALQGLDLVVHRGELLGIVGVSGSGKTTLMNILGGLDRPSAGRVCVDGHSLESMSASSLNRYRRSRVGFVWQHAGRNLIPYLSALENVTLPAALLGMGARQAHARALELLEMVGLADRAGHRLIQLSGGEQQRVALAVALVNRPALLLADEPTGELDSAAAGVVYGIFQRLGREFGLTTLIVSHDPGIAQQMDRVVEVRDGKLSTETVRQAALSANEANETSDFHQMVILDAAGRLQVPKEYLAHFGIRRRAQLDLTPEGILIRPSAENGSESSLDTRTNTAPDAPAPGGHLPRRSLWSALTRRLDRKGRQP